MQRKGEKMANFNSSLILKEMVFDKIEFERKGFKSNKELEFNLQVQIGSGADNTYKVTLVLNAKNLMNMILLSACPVSLNLRAEKKWMTIWYKI